MDERRNASSSLPKNSWELIVQICHLKGVLRLPLLLLSLFLILISTHDGIAQPTTIGTIADTIRMHGQESAEETALICEDSIISWGQLYHRASQVANALAAEGVTPQDRVAFLDKNSVEHFEVFFGSSLLNAVSVDINWRLAPSEISYIVNDTQSKVIIVGPDFISAIKLIADQLSYVKKIVVLGEHKDYESYKSWVARAPAVDPKKVIQKSDIACQFYTSGTTGRPKGVMLTNDNLFNNIQFRLDNFGISKSSVNLVAMPLFHIGGSKMTNYALFAGCKNVILRNPNPEILVNLISKHRITHTFLVPAILQSMLQVPGNSERDFHSLKTIVYGGSSISEKVLVDAIHTFGCNFWQAYGLTETTGDIVSLLNKDSDFRHLRSAGKANPGVELRIVDPVSRLDVHKGKVGEIWTRSPLNMAGYWNLPKETANTIVVDGWLRTGDAGYLDEEGYLYVTDRIKDMIISGGENIYPAEIENILMSFPGILDAAVIGVPSDRWGETPKAIIVRKPGSNPSAEEVIVYCRERLAHYKCPTSVDFVDSIPRNPSGKVLKRELRAPFWKDRDHP